MDSPFLELLLATLLLGWGLSDFYVRRRNLKNFSSVDLALWFSSLFFGLGPWVSFYYGHGQLPDVDQMSMIEAYITVGLYFFTLVCVRKFTSGVYYRQSGADGKTRTTVLRSLTLNLDSIKPTRVLLIYLSIILLRVYLAAVKGVLFSFGANGDLVKEYDLPYGVVVAQSLSSTLVWGCILWSGIYFWFRPRNRLIPMFILGCEFAFACVQGRRMIVYVGVVFLIGYLLSPVKKGLKHLTYFFVILVILNVIVFPAFIGIRLFYLFPREGENAFVVMEGALEKLWESDRSQISSVYEENMAMRPNLIRFNCQILDAETSISPLYGQALLKSLEWCIPAALFSGKNDLTDFRFFVEDHFDLPRYDPSANWPAYGCADWGLLGGCVSGVIFGFVLTLIEKFSFWLKRKMPYLAYCSVAGVLVLAMSVQQAPMDDWVLIRNLFILLCIGYFIDLFKKSYKIKKSNF